MPWVVEVPVNTPEGDCKQVIATMDPNSKKIVYDNEAISEIIAGQGTGGGFIRNAKVIYRFDGNRVANNDTLYIFSKRNPLVANRIRQVNSLLFGRGFNYSYDDSTKEVVDAFWRYNRVRSRLEGMGSDSQVFGETFIGLFPQQNGQVLMSVYESNQVEIDFDQNDINNIKEYIVSYRDEVANTTKDVRFKPLTSILNEIEFGQSNGTMARTARTIGRKLGLIKGQNVMIHLKFNCTSAETRGTSDLRQAFEQVNNYMDFRSDRQAIHQIYGSPSYDISIESDDPKYIEKRVGELMNFTLGSNPVHNAKETWKPMEFKMTADSARFDEQAMRGLVAASLSFPEHMVFNQSSTENVGGEAADGTIAMHKMIENRQDKFAEAFQDIHKYVVYIAGGDITKVDEGKMTFPTISTMTEKVKAETYTLAVGANIVSRKTACYEMGHNWEIEEQQMITELDQFGSLLQSNPNAAGQAGGRFTTKKDATKPGADDGTRNADKRLRNQTKNTDQTMGDKKKSG